MKLQNMLVFIVILASLCLDEVNGGFFKTVARKIDRGVDFVNNEVKSIVEDINSIKNNDYKKPISENTNKPKDFTQNTTQSHEELQESQNQTENSVLNKTEKNLKNEIMVIDQNMKLTSNDTIENLENNTSEKNLELSKNSINQSKNDQNLNNTNIIEKTNKNSDFNNFYFYLFLAFVVFGILAIGIGLYMLFFKKNRSRFDVIYFSGMMDERLPSI